MTIQKFQKTILNWYKHNRRGLPWRKTRDPYKILVSEVMLQQTQVSRVLPKYKEFLKAFPTISILARARIKTLLKVWAGLGYWRRALYLKETAKILASARRDFEGRSFGILLPEQLEKLPGVGPYTARALACFAFNNSEAFLDTNIRRVYLHFFFSERKNVSDKEILKIAQKAVDSVRLRPSFRRDFGEIKEWHYALFDYGDQVLKDKKINRGSKHYHKQSRFEGSFRSFRTKVVHFLLSKPGNKALPKTLFALLKSSPYPPKQILSSLLKDRLIKKSKTYYSL